jgi:Fe-S cluster assembly protein SufB
MRLRGEFFNINFKEERMAYTEAELAKELKDKKYEFGFVSNFESDKAPIGLNEDIIRLISAKKNEPEWMLEYRLNAFKVWQEMTEPTWAHVHYPKVDFQDIYYYSAPKIKKKLNSLDELDPELKSMYDKLGISTEEQKRLEGV